MNFDLKNKKSKAVILCAGRGVRMNEISVELPKVLLPIKEKPLLWYVIDYWKKYVDEFVFVVGHQKAMVIDYLQNLEIKKSFIEQNELRGIADAVLRAEEKIDDNFILILGDCFCRGEFDFPDSLEQGIGVWKTNDEELIKKSYSVEVKGDHLKKVVEKPEEIVNDLCGMGFYFFQPKVFDYIRKTPPSILRHEVEITDVIQKMIDNGEEVKAINFSGKYANINADTDLTELEKFFTKI